MLILIFVVCFKSVRSVVFWTRGKQILEFQKQQQLIDYAYLHQLNRATDRKHKKQRNNLENICSSFRIYKDFLLKKKEKKTAEEGLTIGS